MESGNITRVNVAKTWDLVCRHRIYSRPAETHTVISDANFLLLHAGDQNQTMEVVGVWKFNPSRCEVPERVPIVWRERLKHYISDARQLREILNQPGNYYFFGLAKTSWPVWLCAMANIRDLDVQAGLSLWRERQKFFHWPRKAEVLWQGVTRHPDGAREDCYTYPEHIK